MKFTHLFGMFSRPFSKAIEILHFHFNQLSTYIEIYAVLLLAKLVPIYTVLVCKIFGTKIWSCKNFDKFQVWI